MVYIKSLEKNIFPNYVEPYEDELFSSWLCRLSINHNVKPQSFFLNYFGKDAAIWNRDIDLYTPSKKIEILSNHTPLSFQHINSLLLTSYEGYLYENGSNKLGKKKNVLEIGVQHRQRNLFGLQYCPVCLKRNQYYKKPWRLSTSILCIKCNVLLHDRCHKCGSPIMFYRNYMGINNSTLVASPMSFCGTCKHNLGHSPKISPTETETNYQTYINNTIAKGYNDCCSYSFEYITVLFIIMHNLTTESKKNKFKNSAIKILEESNLLDPKWIYLNDLKRRQKLLPVIHSILYEKPHLLKKIITNGGIYKSYFAEGWRLPYWFLSKFNL
jgi:hypothetical protein